MSIYIYIIFFPESVTQTLRNRTCWSNGSVQACAPKISHCEW